MKNRAFDHSKYKDWIDPEETQPYPLNSKLHTDRQIKNIANSIRRFGWQQDTVLTSDNVLVIGHGRRLAAIQLGCQMPYHRIDKKADELTDKDIRELRHADNLTNSETGYDFELQQEDMEDLDFDGFEFDFPSDMDFPENLDSDEEYSSETELAIKFTFANYTAYQMYEEELKAKAEEMGAKFSVVKA